MQLGVPPCNIGEMMDTLTPLPSQQCRFYYLIHLIVTCHWLVDVTDAFSAFTFTAKAVTNVHRTNQKARARCSIYDYIKSNRKQMIEDFLYGTVFSKLIAVLLIHKFV